MPGAIFAALQTDEEVTKWYFKHLRGFGYVRNVSR
jgi:hypothetical protein